ncbi:hypothetical protein IFM89_025814 [Coptis chinensis]|uniref:Uncharacterized protein n=1 Tax=Coptis chinensis TaxID=261450 RepID=A0A835HH07_9MAGN|nr:hypothetical protein IFM89_025814 [Coptis chinensis]
MVFSGKGLNTLGRQFFQRECKIRQMNTAHAMIKGPASCEIVQVSKGDRLRIANWTGLTVRSWIQLIDEDIKELFSLIGELKRYTVHSDRNGRSSGSAKDTVIDAGMFDGSLGIVYAVSAVKVLKIEGKLENIRRLIEVSEI